MYDFLQPVKLIVTVEPVKFVHLETVSLRVNINTMLQV